MNDIELLEAIYAAGCPQYHASYPPHHRCGWCHKFPSKEMHALDCLWLKIEQHFEGRVRMAMQQLAEVEVGYTSCWATVEGKPGNCRKPQGHDGACAPF